jgi:hypothetical protein
MRTFPTQLLVTSWPKITKRSGSVEDYSLIGTKSWHFLSGPNETSYQQVLQMDQRSQLGVGQTSRHVRKVDCHWKLLFTMNINFVKGWLVICYFPFGCTWFPFGHFEVWQLNVEKLCSIWLIRKNSLNASIPDRRLTMSSQLIALFPSNMCSSPSNVVEGRVWSFEGVCFGCPLRMLWVSLRNHLKGGSSHLKGISQ